MKLSDENMVDTIKKQNNMDENEARFYIKVVKRIARGNGNGRRATVQEVVRKVR